LWKTRRKIAFKWATYGVFAVVLLVLQSARTPGLTLWGAGMNMLPFLVAAVAHYENLYMAGAMGFFSGLLLAVHSNTAEGLACLYLSLFGVLVGWLFETFFRKNVLLPMMAGVLCIAISELCKAVFYYMLVYNMPPAAALLTLTGALILALPGGVLVCFGVRWLSSVFREEDK